MAFIIFSLPFFFGKPKSIIMKISLKTKILSSTTLFIISWLLLNYAKKNPENIQKYYTQYIYKAYSDTWINIVENFNFSIGDILYLILISGMLISVYKLIRKKESIQRKIILALVNTYMGVSVFWLVFNLTWGLNNYNIPLQNTLGIPLGYNSSQVTELTKLLVQQTTAQHKELSFHKDMPIVIGEDLHHILLQASSTFNHLAIQTNAFSARQTNVKPSLFSPILTYMGFSGYVNPFTTEAQINYKIPKLTTIVTASHEIAHQLGFAKESEANFLGYLNAKNQTDLKYQYAANIFALRYCLSELKKSESTEFLEILESIPLGILYNIQENSIFWLSYKNFADSLFHIFYDSFLKANNQKQGLQSYNRFVDFLVNYHYKQDVPITN